MKHSLTPTSSSPVPFAPPEPADLGAVIPIRGARPQVSPTVIAVTSGKGGVGKTNVSVNLAVALGNHGARVLAIDADLGLANMDIVMGLAPTYTAVELLRGEVEIDDVLLPGSTNVWLLPGASGAHDLANLDDIARRNLFAAVDTLDQRFDAVVVDTGAGIGANAVGFASAARDIIVVVTPEPTSVADAYGMLKVLCNNAGVRRVKILTNMVASDHEGEEVFARLAKLATGLLGIGLDHVGSIPRDPAVGRAVMRGEPVVLAYPTCAAAKAFGKVASRLLASDERDERQGSLRLFWRRLLQQEAGR
jgi:flagellar biosynthesis protein FlhG